MSLYKDGFTLLEVLIVLVILGTLAGLAIPVYQNTIQRNYVHEAVMAMGAAKRALVTHYSQHGRYTNACLDVAIPGGCVACNLAYCPNSTNIGGQKRHFTYNFRSLTSDYFTLRATRNTIDGGDGISTICINVSGVIDSSPIYTF